MQQAHQTKEQDGVKRALLLDNDLFFSVKVTDTLRHSGIETHTVRRLEDFVQALAAEQPALALVNTAARGIDWRAAIIAAHQARVPCIAFGAHVDLETQEAARQAGATRVISNSRLASDLPGIVGRLLRAADGKNEIAAKTASDGATFAAITEAETEADSAMKPAAEPK
jgi:DNA-binding NtrC family response regulator